MGTLEVSDPITGKGSIMYNENVSQEEQELREQETAHERARGHVAELRRLWEQGAPLRAAQQYFDQIEADLNTSRPRHAGWSTNYAATGQPAPDAPITTPTGVSGRPGEPASDNAPALDENGNVIVEDQDVTEDDERRADERVSEGDTVL